MKISRVSLFFCYVMRYKYAIIGIVLSLICSCTIGVKGIAFLLFGFVALLFNVWCNTTNLFESKFNKNGFVKKWMYNKYKDEIGFKYAVVYNDTLKEYKYIPFASEYFYISNIYLLIIKTYQKEEYLAYECETRHSSSIVFIGSSKIEVSELLCEFLTNKIRRIYEVHRGLEKECDNYSEIHREIEYKKYSK